MSEAQPASVGHTVRSYDQELHELSRQIIEMGGLVEREVAGAIDALVKLDPELANETAMLDEQVDQLEQEIDQNAIRLLATRQPVAVDLRHVAMALKISNELERIGDYARNIARRAERLTDTGTIKPLITIPRMAQMAQAMVKDVLDAYVESDLQRALAVWHRDDELDETYNSLFRELLTYMMEDPRHISVAIDLLFIAKNVERMGDHATNIAEKIHYMVSGERINRLPNPHLP